MGHPSSKPCTHPTHHLEPVCTSSVHKDLTPSELDGHTLTFIIDIHTPLPCQQHQEILKSPSVSVFPISPPTSTQGTISPASLKGLATAASDSSDGIIWRLLREVKRGQPGEDVQEYALVSLLIRHQAVKY